MCSPRFSLCWSVLLQYYSLILLNIFSFKNATLAPNARDCEANDFIKRLDFAYPSQANELVPQTVQISLLGEVFDEAAFIANNALFFTCVRINGKDEFCSDVFDSVITVQLPSPGTHEIGAALCSNEDCLCNISIVVNCCEAIQSEILEEKLMQNFESILELENKFIESNVNNRTVVPAWSCQ